MPGGKAPQWLSFILEVISSCVFIIIDGQQLSLLASFMLSHWFQARTSRRQRLKWSNSFLVGSPSADMARCPKLYFFGKLIKSIQ